MERDIRTAGPAETKAPRTRRGIVSALAAGCVVAVTVGVLVVAGSSGADTEPRSPKVRTPVAAPEPSTIATTAAAPLADAPAEPGVAATVTPTRTPTAGTSAPEAAPPAAPAQFLLVCETPVTDANGIETSSSVVSWVPEGTPVPTGCHRG
jgi:hypothetical protein